MAYFSNCIRLRELTFYTPKRREWAISVVFVCLSVCPSVAYIANNSRTQRQRPSVPKFEVKFPRFRWDSHTNFKIKRSKVRVTDGRGYTVSAEPAGHTACLWWHVPVSISTTTPVERASCTPLSVQHRTCWQTREVVVLSLWCMSRGLLHCSAGRRSHCRHGRRPLQHHFCLFPHSLRRYASWLYTVFQKRKPFDVW